MSTILDALKKAKNAPVRESVQSGKEVLSNKTHDYLASAGTGDDNQFRWMKVAVLSSLVFILVLLGVIVYLVVNMGQPGPAVTSPGEAALPALGLQRAEAPTSTPVATAFPAPAPTATPTVSRVEIVVSTPEPPPPAASATPEVEAVRSEPPDAETAIPPHIRTLEVKAILWDTIDPMAMMNGRIIRPGTMLSPDLRVDSIERDCVILDYKGQTVTIRP